MARYGNFAYPPGMTDSEPGKRLYQCWRQMRKKKDHAEEFDDYQKFYAWAMQAGYTIGCRLDRVDRSKPYSSDNCIWKRHEEKKTAKKRPKVEEDLLRTMDNRLYARFVKLRSQPHTPEFDDFNFFVAWSKENGYTENARLVLIDKEKPYSPDNCRWQAMKTAQQPYGEAERAWCSKWNETVNRIRVACGMDPLPEEMEDNYE